MQKIQKVSLFFRILFQVGFIVLPLASILCWMHAPAPFAIGDPAAGLVFDAIPKGLPILHSLTTSEKVMGFFISLLPTAMTMLILYFLIRLFRMYENMVIFSLDNVKMVSRIGMALLLYQILILPIYQALLSMALTWHNPVGHKVISISIDQTNIGLIFAALLIILISWIMAEGYKLQEESKFTV